MKTPFRTYFYFVLYASALPLAFLTSLFNKKLRQGLIQRLGKGTEVHFPNEKPLWFHVASSGELEQAFPILDEIKRTAPDQKILLSYFSPTAQRAIALEEKRREKQGTRLSWDAAEFAPFDLPWWVQKFMRRHKPSKFIAIHREIWPGIMHGCLKANIPAYLIAFHPAENYKRWEFLFLPYLRQFRLIATTTQEGAKVLASSNLASVPLGDPRVDRVIARKEASGAVSPWRTFFEGQKVMVFASLWPEDFKQVLPAINRLVKDFPTWRILLVPHELDNQFIKTLKRALPGSRRWSHWYYEPDITSHLIVDTVGLLAEMYQIAELVFVGGSFRKKVHNVLEPAAYGSPILTGPFIRNSSEAVEMAATGMGLIACDSKQSFSNLFLRMVQDDTYRREAGQKARLYIDGRAGVSKTIAAEILR